MSVSTKSCWLADNVRFVQCRRMEDGTNTFMQRLTQSRSVIDPPFAGELGYNNIDPVTVWSASQDANQRPPRDDQRCRLP